MAEFSNSEDVFNSINNMRSINNMNNTNSMNFKVKNSSEISGNSKEFSVKESGDVSAFGNSGSDLSNVGESGKSKRKNNKEGTIVEVKGLECKNARQFVNDFNPVNKNGFLLFNEDKVALTNNTKQGLNDIIDKNASIMTSIQHGSDLNKIIEQLNAKRNKKKKSLFDKNNISIFLTYEKLDKFITQ